MRDSRRPLAALLLVSLLLLSGCAPTGADRLKRLRKENPAVLAWLEIPGTDLGLPVYRDKRPPEGDGGFFLQTAYSDEGFSDPVTLLYSTGGTFLQDLYTRNGALSAYPLIRLSLPDGTVRDWRLIGISAFDDSHILSVYSGFANRKNIPLFLQEVKDFHTMLREFAPEAEDVTPDDTLLILSEHLDEYPSQRFLAIAKLESK